MTVRPILFSAPMVRAILREIEKPGTGKTQTRRTLKPQLDCEGRHHLWPDKPDSLPMIDEDGLHCGVCGAGLNLHHRRKSGVRGIPVRFAVSDVLWVRETWSHSGTGVWTISDVYMAGDGKVIYRADEDHDAGCGFWPSIHMPRRFSRLTLVVTDVRVERLQDISEDDAKAEGCDKAFEVRDLKDAIRQIAGAAAGEALPSTYRCGYAKLWDDINGAGSWSQNPWVVAVSFTPHAMNVDAFLAQKEAA